MSTTPRRVAISLAPGEHDALRELAHQADEPLATTAGRLIRAALLDHGATLEAPPARRAGPPRTKRKGPSAPAGATDPIQALRARYPHELRHAPADPTTDTFVAEQIGALLAWREDLDHQPPRDPCAELAFGRELRTIGEWLQTRARRNR